MDEIDHNDVEHVQITTLSAEQRELLQIYLERAEIPHRITTDCVTVPEQRASDLYAALAIVVRARPSEADSSGRHEAAPTEVPDGEDGGSDDEPSPTARPPLIAVRPIVAGGWRVASRGRRFVGAAIDWLSLDLWALAAHQAGAPTWATVATLGLYVVVATAVFGRTLGKFAIGTVVVAQRTGSMPGWLRSVLRWLTTSWFGVITVVLQDLPAGVEIVAFAVLVLTYAPVLWDREGRGWHDRAADTVVVLAKQKQKRKPPLPWNHRP